MQPLFKHQEQDIEFCLRNPIVYNASDPGTGKTRTCIEVIRQLRRPALVLAPKSILRASWENDFKQFAPELTVSVAYAENRVKAFAAPADVYVTNTDATTWLERNPKIMERFTDGILICDEMTAWKHHTTQRSKALRKIAQTFSRRIALSGTPNPNGIMDLFGQMLILDQGERLGRNFWSFRQAVCTPTQVGRSPHAMQWDEKPGAQDAVFDLLSDILIRHRLEDCLDMPEHVTTIMRVPLTPIHRVMYDNLRRHAILELEGGSVTAFNAGSLLNKLLQCLSGTVYSGEGMIPELELNKDRAMLILDLVEQRQHSVVAFLWKHQRNQLTAEAEARKISYAVIDGDTPSEERNRIVEDYQAGNLRVVFAHPASAAHGLTLTRGSTTIWASPTYNAEHFTQFNRRIYRAGQTQRTETILIVAEDTQEEIVFQNLSTKTDRMSLLLSLIG